MMDIVENIARSSCSDRIKERPAIRKINGRYSEGRSDKIADSPTRH